MLLIPETERNPYLAVAKAIWASGEDGEVIARQLAEAFVEIARDGIGPDKSAVAEFARLARLEEELEHDLYAKLYESQHGRQPTKDERASFKKRLLSMAYGLTGAEVSGDVSDAQFRATRGDSSAGGLG